MTKAETRRMQKEIEGKLGYALLATREKLRVTSELLKSTEVMCQRLEEKVIYLYKQLVEEDALHKKEIAALSKRYELLLARNEYLESLAENGVFAQQNAMEFLRKTKDQ